MSMRSQSNPAPAAASVTPGLAKVSQKPICRLPAASARLKRFCGMSSRISVNLGLGYGGGTGEEIEIASGLGLADMLLVKRAVAPGKAWRGRDPRRAAPRELVRQHDKLEAATRHVELDHVAGFDQSKRPTDEGFRRDVENAGTVAGTAH